MAQLEHIGAIEKRLWSAADTLRANSNYASNEYFMPVMGLIFLRHAYSRFLSAKAEIEPTLPSRGGKVRELTKEDFSRKNAIYLRPEAQFDTLVSLPDREDRAKALIGAMESIEADYETLRGVLPKNEYRELDNEVLGKLLRDLNPEELKQVSGDVFGRIYEYFLTQFAGEKAHDGGEFFTPVSLVSLIAHVLDPQGGVVLDPACGSGGMFVQSARIVQEHGENPTERLTFRGLEKNATTIRLAKMNLAVHGLEGDIQQAITYYDDPHELLRKADYVMANPPFNVDEIDADKIKNDPRLPFGLPGINKQGKVSNGNYVWISYFHSYLSEKGRAGFVMSSQASSAGGKEDTLIRQKLIETGDVEAMVAVRGKFFYTRGVPCELWFFNREKTPATQDKVLMIDARNVFRQVNRRICDFSPEQEKNLLSIVHLYRGETGLYQQLILDYEEEWRGVRRKLEAFDCDGFMDIATAYKATYYAEEDDKPEFDFQAERLLELGQTQITYALQELAKQQKQADHCMPETRKTWSKTVAPIRQALHDLKKLLDQQSADFRKWNRVAHKDHFVQSAAQTQTDCDELLELIHAGLYWIKQLDWHHKRFPESVYRDFEGLCKVVDDDELEKNDWSLTPGRYVGVAPEVEDEDFDFEETLKALHVELAGLNEEAVELAAKIQMNFEGLV